MSVRVLTGDARDVLKTLPDASAHCAVTSPPYFGLRDYGVPGHMGLEATPELWVQGMVEVFREVRRVLRPDGTLWLNIGDSYNNRAVSRPSSHQGGLGFRNESIDTSWADHASAGRAHLSITSGGLKEKDLLGIPWLLAFALRADGWYLRADIIWSKPNPMPESVTDRPTKAHEYLFLLSKSRTYYYDANAIREAFETPLHAPGNTYRVGNQGGGRTDDGYAERMDATWGNPAGRNKRSVWTVATEAFPESHFATYPTALIEPCIKAGCPEGGTVLDPFFGAGTTGLVADRLNRNCIGIEINPTYAEMARRRITGDSPMFTTVDVA